MSGTKGMPISKGGSTLDCKSTGKAATSLSKELFEVEFHPGVKRKATVISFKSDLDFWLNMGGTAGVLTLVPRGREFYFI